MQITREERPERQVALMLEFTAQEIEPTLQKTYQRLVGKVNIPGFRPGKAPRQMFERYVGRDRLIQEASEGLMAGAVKDALEQEQLQDATLEDAHIESTDPLRIHLVLDQGPLVELGRYDDIRVARDPVEVSDAEVDLNIERSRRRGVTWREPAEPRPARMDDRVTVDIETFTIDGPVAQMTGTDQTLELSETTGPVWPHEIDENIAGMTAGEEKDFAITFPPAYTDEALRGREATVHVKLNRIEETDLPALDDEWAQQTAHVENLAALRTEVDGELRRQAEARALAKQARAVLDTLIARSRVEVSSTLIAREVDSRFERLTADLQRRRIAPARYFTYEGTTEKAWREAQREPARAALREMLVVRAFVDQEGIAVRDAEVEAEMARFLAPYAESPDLDKLRGILDTPEQREQITNDLLERKLKDRLAALAGGSDAAPGVPEAADAELPESGAAAEEPETAGGGAVPATEQEPGPLEVAGGAAEVLGNGMAVADHEPAAAATEEVAGAET